MRNILSIAAAIGLVSVISVADARVYVSGGVVIRQAPISIGYSSPAYRYNRYYQPYNYYQRSYYPNRYYRTQRYNNRRNYRGNRNRNNHYYRRW